MRSFNLYTHEWIDNLNFTFKPQDFLPDSGSYIQVAKKLFKNAGWNGDGEIQLIWVPPFMLSSGFTLNEEALGMIIWHVKQEGDGISWLFSPKKKFPPIRH
ncbi:hypothetical protein LPB87_09155 [Flavobacterium sp. EDS]|uniref:hypothetical protein n=1 Tax=Flavobacterium sp. EDS TaxID=2897328 RepID=UPI001E63BEA0|nr:hypothetical protein [Flavobacterium sp. EDS]MCD0474559.1 hypothetical protein [Flavobacterium sp. EDS]